MMIIENKISVKDYLTKSKLPASDYIINPYVGCPHGCKYCYARFMKRFTGHTEEWGEFIDIKECNNPINLEKIKGKSIFLSSVTDCYNTYEETYESTRFILKQLIHADCQITISTKSSLILRDVDLLQKLKNLKVALSINTLNETFRADMDHASSIHDRLHVLKELHDAGINTVLFMSPIFPYITEWKQIIAYTKDFISEYWFENLNLRGEYKKRILAYIYDHYPELKEEYHHIYLKHDHTYWITQANDPHAYCEEIGVKYVNFFYYDQLVKEKQISKSS